MPHVLEGYSKHKLPPRNSQNSTIVEPHTLEEQIDILYSMLREYFIELPKDLRVAQETLTSLKVHNIHISENQEHDFLDTEFIHMSQELNLD